MSNKKMTTSKLLIFYIFLSCTALQVFTCLIMWKMLAIAALTGIIDFTPLVTLIGSIVGEAFSYAIYSAKAARENVLKISNSITEKEEEEANG